MLLRSWTVVGQQYAMVTRPELPMLPAPKASDDLHEVVIGRVARRLIPFAFVCYVVAYIDRVNIGFAASALQRDLGLSATAYGIGAGLFFLGYCVFEVPSNLDTREGRRETVDRANSDCLGTRVDGHDVRDRRHVLLYRAHSARASPRRDSFRDGALPYLLDPCRGSRTHWRPLHDGRTDRRHRRRTGLGSAAVNARMGRAARLAMALRRRGSACGRARRPGTTRADRHARGGHLAGEGRAGLADRDAEARAGRASVPSSRVAAPDASARLDCGC